MPRMYLALSGTIKRETPKAVLFEFLDEDGIGVKSEWFPLSQMASIHRAAEVCKPDVIMVSEWILREKGALHLATSKNPALTGTPKPLGHPVPTTPPVKSWSEMDDDIPF